MDKKESSTSWVELMYQLVEELEREETNVTMLNGQNGKEESNNKVREV